MLIVMIEIFNLIIVNPIINCLLLVYQALFFLHIPFALGFSIIVITVLVRILLYPFTAQQLRASKKMQELAPHLAKVKELHKGDPGKLQSETMGLYKAHGVNPAAGCLTMVIQLPIIWGIYSVFDKVIKLNPNETVSAINKIAYVDFLKLKTSWDTYFFFLPLEAHPSDLLAKTSYLILLVPVITGALQFVQSKMMFKKSPQPKITDSKKEKSQPDFASAFQSQALYIFPVMFGFLSYTFPLGLSLYWNTFTIFGIIQQYRLQKEASIASPAVIQNNKKEKRKNG